MSGRAKAPAPPVPRRRSKRGGTSAEPGGMVEASPTRPMTSGASAPSEAASAPGPRRAVLELMRDVQSGAVDPRNIGPDDRRACVAYLTAEGYTVPEIAQVLKTCDRTVHRDREKVRAENALRPSAGLVTQLVGQLSAEAMTAVQRLRRIGRDKDAPHSARVDAERGAWLVYREFVQSMQRLGYLPTAVPSVSAHVTHQLSPLTAASPGGGAGAQDLPMIEEMHAELARLEELQRSMGLCDAGPVGLATAASAAVAADARGGPGGVHASVVQARRAILLLEAGHHIESARLGVEAKAAEVGASVDGSADA